MASSVELKRFAATRTMKGVMGRYFTELMGPEASGKKIAWCTSLGPAEKAEGVRFVKREENAAIYEIGSSSYHFVVDNCPLSISSPRPTLVTSPANTN